MFIILNDVTRLVDVFYNIAIININLYNEQHAAYAKKIVIEECKKIFREDFNFSFFMV